MFWKSWLCKDWWRAPKTISFLSIRNSWISERAGDASYLSSQQSWLIIVTCVAIWSTCSPDSSVPSYDDQSQIIPLHPFSLDFDLTLAENIFGAFLTFPPEFLSAGGSKRRKRVKLVSLPEPPAEERPPAKPPTELWYQAGKHDQQQKTSLCYVKFLDKLDKNPILTLQDPAEAEPEAVQALVQEEVIGAASKHPERRSVSKPLLVSTKPTSDKNPNLKHKLPAKEGQLTSWRHTARN